jgi:uncharacterized surface protein with fasciclin (FAS1) repeats
VTALVPTNAAIAALPDGAAILVDPVAFEAFLRSHIVAGSLTTDEIFALPQLTTLGGDTIVVDPMARMLTGPSATPAGVQIADLDGVNGYVDTLTAALAAPPLSPATATTPSC